MRGKPLKSTDPFKRELMDAIKRDTGATKVTCVRDLGDGKYSARLFRKDHEGRGGKFTPMGVQYFDTKGE